MVLETQTSQTQEKQEEKDKMVRVCEDTIKAKGKTKAGFYMDDILKANIDIYVKNAMRDWDFVLIISGEGQVRVGKSVLGLQIAYYWKDQMKKVHNIDVPFTIDDNIVFNGSELIEKGNKLGKKHPHSPLIFDEAGADLRGVKIMHKSTQAVTDFLRECGQYNLFIVLVLPDFFDLPKGIAMHRADCLLNVFVIPNEKSIWDRGFFEFYGRPAKKKLWLYGKKDLNYKAAKYDFHGRFYNKYTVDEVKYRALKQEALEKREQEQVKDKYIVQRNVMFQILEEDGYSHHEISEKLKEKDIIIGRAGVSLAIASVKGKISNKIVYKEGDEGGGVG